MEYSPFISQNSKGAFDYPSCSWQPVVMYICFRNVNFLLGYGRNTCSDKATASSPTSTNGMDNPSASLGRTLGSGIFSLFLSSYFPNVGFLKTRVTRRTVGSNLYWYETTVCICHSHEDRREKVLVIEKLRFTLIWIPYLNNNNNNNNNNILQLGYYPVAVVIMCFPSTAPMQLGKFVLS